MNRELLVVPLLFCTVVSHLIWHHWPVSQHVQLWMTPSVPTHIWYLHLHLLELCLRLKQPASVHAIRLAACQNGKKPVPNNRSKQRFAKSVSSVWPQRPWCGGCEWKVLMDAGKIRAENYKEKGIVRSKWKFNPFTTAPMSMQALVTFPHPHDLVSIASCRSV